MIIGPKSTRGLEFHNPPSPMDAMGGRCILDPPPPPRGRGMSAAPDREGEPQGCIRREGPPRQPQRRLGRRLEEVAKAVGGGYCRLQMPLRLALGVRGTVAGHGLGALGGVGAYPFFEPKGAHGTADADVLVLTCACAL